MFCFRAGRRGAQSLQADRPRPPLLRCKLAQGFYPRARKHPRLRRVPRVAGVVGELVGPIHTVDTIDLGFHQPDPLEGLPVLNANPSINLDDRYLSLSPSICQFAFRRAASSSCARTETASPTTAEASDRSGSRAAISARHTATLAVGGIDLLMAMAATVLRGSIRARSTPISEPTPAALPLPWKDDPRQREGFSVFVGI